MNRDHAQAVAPREDCLGEDAMSDHPTDAPHPSPTESGSMPLDPVYAWGIVLEPVETLIEHTGEFIEQLAKETRVRGEEFSLEELEGRFTVFFDRLVGQGVLTRLPDAPPAMGIRILGPRRWLRGQRIRINRLAAQLRDYGCAEGSSCDPRGADS